LGEPNDLSAAEQPGPKTEEFLKLLGAHERGLFAYVYALSPNWQDAEEVMQRVRIRVWQQFDQYDVNRPFDAWARAIAYYLVLAHRKEKTRQREVFSEQMLEKLNQQYEAHFEAGSARRDALRQCLDRLDRRKRDLVRTYYSATRQSAEEIARQLSMTPNAVRQAVFRIRRLLHECVDRAVNAESHE
jgi:RNA polymerase sigma-70 factor, ECF subfamily